MSLRPYLLSATRTALVGVLLSAALMAGLVSAQSLGDVARQEEARRKSVKTAGKVYTNGDLRFDPTVPTAPADSPDASAPAPAPALATPAADAKKDEAAWRKRMQDIKDALDRSQTFADALQSRINGLSADFAARDDPAQRAVVASDRQKALTELDRVKKEIQLHTKEMADLQEEARKSGVPAGWLR